MADAAGVEAVVDSSAWPEVVSMVVVASDVVDEPLVVVAEPVGTVVEVVIGGKLIVPVLVPIIVDNGSLIDLKKVVPAEGVATASMVEMTYYRDHVSRWTDKTESVMGMLHSSSRNPLLLQINRHQIIRRLPPWDYQH